MLVCLVVAILAKVHSESLARTTHISNELHSQLLMKTTCQATVIPPEE